MKYKYLILILLCLSLQSKEQTIANNSTVDNITTSDKYVPKTKEEGEVVKAQQGVSLGYLKHAKEYEEAERARVHELAKQQQQAQEAAKAQQGGYLGYDEEAEIARDREWYKQQQQANNAAKVEQAVASRNAILTYGSIGIVLLFIITAIAAFSILYVRRNKDNPKYRKP